MAHKTKRHDDKHHKHDKRPKQHKGSHRSDRKSVVDQLPADVVVEPFHAAPPPLRLLPFGRLEAVLDTVIESLERLSLLSAEPAPDAPLVAFDALG